MPISIDIEKDYLYNLGLKKAEEEKAKLEAEVEKARADKKSAVKKMKSTGRFSDEEIMEFLNLDQKTFKAFLKEIKN